jgi:hypothetical protein
MVLLVTRMLGSMIQQFLLGVKNSKDEIGMTRYSLKLTVILQILALFSCCYFTVDNQK